jgi:hypothetical protein
MRYLLCVLFLLSTNVVVAEEKENKVGYEEKWYGYATTIDGENEFPGVFRESNLDRLLKSNPDSKSELNKFKAYNYTALAVGVATALGAESNQEIYDRAKIGVPVIFVLSWVGQKHLIRAVDIYNSREKESALGVDGRGVQYVHKF